MQGEQIASRVDNCIIVAISSFEDLCLFPWTTMVDVHPCRLLLRFFSFLFVSRAVIQYTHRRRVYWRSVLAKPRVDSCVKDDVLRALPAVMVGVADDSCQT